MKLANWSARTRVIIVCAVVVYGVGIAIGAQLSSPSNSAPRAVSTTTTAPAPTTTVAPSTTTTTTQPQLAANRCPLTDLPVRGVVPRRPALLVKVGNEPFGARPQSGLNEADIVFDTPAEGFIMRYIAVFQCRGAASIGPTRSVRWVDWHLARQFIHPILAFAGGINPNVDQVGSFKWLGSANLLEGGQAAGVRTTNRVPPDNLYTSTSALYSLFPTRRGRPKPIFSFTNAVPAGGQRTASLAINFSYDTDVVWKWNAASGLWDHTYSGVPDIDALTNRPVTTKNIVVLIVDYQFGPYIESPGGSGDFESQTLGRGVGYILRNGVAIKVTWTRKYLIDPFTFTRAHETVTLAPGRSWVELVPAGTVMAFGR